jgi:Cu/Ag efflux protein CusF
MKRLLWTIGITAFGMMQVGAVIAAQSKTVPGEMKTVTGTVEAIDVAARKLSIKTGKEYEEIDVPAGVQGFANVKVGDRLNLRYYDNIVLILKKPGDPDVDVGTSGVAVTPNVPGRSGTAARQRTITATITAIDRETPTITFNGPHNWSFVSPVKDRKALDKVKVGDKVDITWTAAVLVSLDPAK